MLMVLFFALISEFTFEYDPSANVAVPLNSMLRTDAGIEVIHHGKLALHI